MAETLIRKELKEAFLEQGIQDTHFFNGRLLTAGDLVKVQDASRRRDHQLGLGVGSGIVSGLEVRLIADGSDGKPPVLAVSKGLAFDRLGQAVALPQDAEVLLDKEKPDKLPPAGSFDYCVPLQQNGKPIPGKGAYLFTIRQASDYIGQAPRRGFGQTAKVEGCDRDLVLEGAQFRLVSVDVTNLDNLAETTRLALAELLKDTENAGLPGLSAQNKLRNWLAHACFGTEELQGWLRDPFARQANEFFGTAVDSSFHNYGVVGKLRSQGSIDDCDVPLALICWTATGVKWVDMWSVRRRLAAQALSAAWPQPTDDLRLAEAEAAFQQFQDQVNFLLQKLGPVTLVNAHATEYFRFLPAVGILPGARGTFRGFNPNLFFDQPHRDVEYIDGLIVGSLVADALHYFPMDLESDELVWLYQPWQNAKAIDDGANIQPYVVFTTGQMPHRALARLDVARWDYSQYADAVPGV
ncbi:MAG: hypothetical protein WCD37_04375 [Chloroflexia bacterium]